MRVEIPSKLIPVFAGDARYRGAWGGRGSGKSVTFARMLLLRGAAAKIKILCAREMQNSIKDSVHAELVGQIEALGLGWFYDYGESFVRGKNGTEIIYKGLRHNYQSIKSTAGIDICWVEEAEYVSEESWRTLIPTIRKPGSEIWLTWNPERTDSPTKKRFVDIAPDGAKIVAINWRDNPWFPAELDSERLTDMRRDYDSYRHVWEGECVTRSDAQVLNGKWRIDRFEPGEGWNGPYFGADWGFSVDPTVLVKCWVHDSKLYIEHEAYGIRTELNDLPALFDTIPDSRRHKIYGDSARPETISHVNKSGFKVEACEKWKGSVEDGIEHMRGAYDEIVIHDRCTHTAQEASLYSYKIDKLTGLPTADIVDKHNHCMDAMRYAIGKLIKRKNSFWTM